MEDRCVPVFCADSREARRQNLEDMPMRQLCFSAQEGQCCPWGLGELVALTECQNRLLMEILASLNALTATQVTHRRCSER